MLKGCFILLSLALVFTACSNVEPTPEESENVFTYGGHTYVLINSPLTWEQAAAAAKLAGGYLVEINSAEEQAEIEKNMSKLSSSAVTDGGGGQYFWIGATDKTTEGTWVWDGNNDGTSSALGKATTTSVLGISILGTWTASSGAYQNWGRPTGETQKEPDDFGGNQDAAAMGLTNWPNGAKGQWNDIAMTNTLPYIIEKE